MVSVLERNISFAGLGIIYCVLGYKMYNKVTRISENDYKIAKEQTINFFDKNKLPNSEYIFLDNNRKVIILYGVEDSPSIVLNNNILKKLFFEITPNRVIVERSFY